MSTEELSVEAFRLDGTELRGKPAHPFHGPAFEPNGFGAATRNRQLEHCLTRSSRTLWVGRCIRRGSKRVAP
jgi:hypothetical protein